MYYHFKNDSLWLVLLIIMTVILSFTTSGISAGESYNNNNSQSPGFKRYIIKVKTAYSQAAVKLKAYLNSCDTDASPTTLSNSYGPAAAFKGHVGTFNQTVIDKIQHDYPNEIEYIEEDAPVYLSISQPNPPSWGLSRTSSRENSPDAPYIFPWSGGRDVSVYVIDTGVDATHNEFRGRASVIQNYITTEENTDTNGHGTHVCGIIGSYYHGVAKLARIRAVKVLDKSGGGMMSNVISALNYVAARIVPGKTAISMSLAGSTNRALNDAVTSVVQRGAPVFVAAGNSGGDACTFSPAGASGAFAVGSIDSDDTMSSFSNYGRCVRVLAPGRNIVSLYPGNDTAMLTGTSMAAPHVTGVAALLMARRTYTSPLQVYRDIISLATPNLATGNLQGTPNLILYNGGSYNGTLLLPPATP